MVQRTSLVLYVAALFLQWETSSARRYLGCYTDSKVRRILPVYVDRGEKTTIDFCTDYCQGQGYKFAAGHFYSWCGCGHNYPLYNTIIDASHCNAPCKANKSEMCGGKDNLYTSIYVSDESEATQNLLPFVGCFVTLPCSKEISKLLSPMDCVLGCEKDNFKYAGLQETTCMCSNEAPVLAQVKGASPKACEKHIRVYFARKEYHKRYMGCYKMVDGVWPKGEQIANLGRTCPEQCYRKGFRYAASENQYKCYCSNDRPTYKMMAPDSNCLNVCESSVFEFCVDPGHVRVFDLAVGHSFDPQLKLEGCYLDNHKSCKLLNSCEIILMENTPEKCAGLCYHLEYMFAGVKQGNLCRCGHELLINEGFGTCTTRCPGDHQETCGGKDSIAIYNTEYNCNKTTHPLNSILEEIDD